MALSPWAILLCKFKDQPQSMPWNLARYRDLFTQGGSGSFNIVDYFRDMSHGRMDLSGSKVFDNIKLDKNLAEYKGSGLNQKGRDDLLAWAKQAASASSVNLSLFYNVVVVTNVSVDLFGGPNGAVTGDGRYPNGMTALSPSFMGQEMAHGYWLLGHSKKEGSEEIYKDPWDIMSTAMWPTMAPHSVFNERDNRGNPIFLMGPGMNAANMSALGWLDTSRLCTANTNIPGTVQIRPLHRIDLPGYLAIRIGSYFVEFRMPESWDAAIGDPVVLIHKFSAGSSYIQPAKKYRGPTIYDPFQAYSDAESEPRYGLTKGDIFQEGDPTDPLGYLLKIAVLDINPITRTATIGTYYRRDQHPKVGPALEFGEIGSDAGGIRIIGGRPKKIPPWSPLYAITEVIDQAVDGEFLSAMPRGLAQLEAYDRIARIAQDQAQRLRASESPAPFPSRAEDDVEPPSLPSSSEKAKKRPKEKRAHKKG